MSMSGPNILTELYCTVLCCVLYVGKYLYEDWLFTIFQLKSPLTAHMSMSGPNILTEHTLPYRTAPYRTVDYCEVL